MQSGRMKGQAFVGLPSEEAAATALRETNGYQLAGKPLVVVSHSSSQLPLALAPPPSAALCQDGQSQAKSLCHIMIPAVPL